MRKIAVYDNFTEPKHRQQINDVAAKYGFAVDYYAAPDALLTAVESRSSSPVRIGRDETYQCNIRGLYPCGEGAGYAGGILSAAADGMRCAEQMIKEL